jgi:hypothetical protein
MAATALGEVEHDAARSPLDLIGRLWAVRSELRDHRAQGTNEIEGHVIGNQHVFSWVFIWKETPSADDLRGWATPVATDPRQDP